MTAGRPVRADHACGGKCRHPSSIRGKALNRPRVRRSQRSHNPDNSPETEQEETNDDTKRKCPTQFRIRKRLFQIRTVLYRQRTKQQVDCRNINEIPEWIERPCAGEIQMGYAADRSRDAASRAWQPRHPMEPAKVETRQCRRSEDKAGHEHQERNNGAQDSVRQPPRIRHSYAIGI